MDHDRYLTYGDVYLGMRIVCFLAVVWYYIKMCCREDELVVDDIKTL